MRTQLYAAGARVMPGAAVLTILFLAGCRQSRPPVSTPAASEAKTSAGEIASEKVFVEFHGPWAFASDPQDPQSVLAIAPRAKRHRDLYVQASNQSSLAPGIYDLGFPSHSGQAAATADAGIAHAKIDAANLQRALDTRSERYVIRLPKPEEYVVASRSRSRLGGVYPPDVSTEKEYATAVSLRYNAGTLNGFSLSGTPDSGVFNSLLLQVETPVIRFVIAPSEEDDVTDKCELHSRESFHQLTLLLGLALYVDFPDYPDDCHKNDPQNIRADRRARPGELQAERLIMAAYVFDHPGGDCKSPLLILDSGR
jgi:hypothetical protein